jgi:hypothetical protein
MHSLSVFSSCYALDCLLQDTAGARATTVLCALKYLTAVLMSLTASSGYKKSARSLTCPNRTFVNFNSGGMTSNACLLDMVVQFDR